MELPLFIQRCLAYGIKIYPYQIKTVLMMAKKYRIPDEEMIILNHKQIEIYIDGLYLSGQEMSKDWDRGHNLLKDLGFQKSIAKTGHRSFVSLDYKKITKTILK